MKEKGERDQRKAEQVFILLGRSDTCERKKLHQQCGSEKVIARPKGLRDCPWSSLVLARNGERLSHHHAQSRVRVAWEE